VDSEVQAIKDYHRDSQISVNHDADTINKTKAFHELIEERSMLFISFVKFRLAPSGGLCFFPSTFPPL